MVGAFSYHPTVHASALDSIHRKIIPADQIITHTFPLGQVSDAFEAAASGEGLKIVIEM